MIDHRAIETIAWRAAQEPAVLEVYLFGSRVRGRNKDGGPVRDDSDLDIGMRTDLPPLDEPAERQAHWTAFKRFGSGFEEVESRPIARGSPMIRPASTAAGV